MLYFVCFIISIIIFLWSVAKSDFLKINQFFLLIITVISNGGYYALACSTTLEKAVLANNLTYLLGIFSPMLLFFNVCEVCKIQLPKPVVTVLYTFQMLLYLSVCTTGKSDIFYKSVELNMSEYGSYLTKTYGPMHTVYLVTMVAFLIASMTVALRSINKKNTVSIKNVEMIIFIISSFFFTYMLQRLLKLKVEMIPVVFTAGIVMIMFSITKNNNYSIDRNSEIVNEKLESFGYIVFSKKLHYMGCSNNAAELFPELEQWELEKNIPGSGGRFNTFLRQPFMSYVNSDSTVPMKCRPFVIKDKSYSFTVRRLNSGRRHIGYIIEITDNSPADGFSRQQLNNINGRENNAEIRLCR